ncbi:MAG: aspartyl-tRNA(Asn)/glutamyl-tRNA(Gln) amidotransferase subunit, partial [Gaiellaceae bacterium]|nr:aspartyl-tRNA(Asn)/glutamyl-tRNA(Gln) amidotransferase subunit [Gaiellaceae bacterium]
VPLDGVFPLSPNCDHVGTLTANVEQTARLLAVLAARPIELRPVAGLRIGVLRRQLDDPDLTSGVHDRVQAAIDALAAAGFEVVDVEFAELGLANAALGSVVLREAWEVHRTLYARDGEKYGAGTRALLELGSRIGDGEYRQGLAVKEQVVAAFARVFEDVDVLAGPTVAYPAPPVDPPFGTPEGELEGRYTAPYNLAGVPAVSLPCGIAEGTLPAGLQLAAASGEDALLLSVARAYEEVAP